jgi:AraC family transcriptional regulator
MASRLESIHQTLQFIEEHLRDQISVADMADHCGYSIYHFIRLFNHFSRQTPYDYLIRRRLSEALKDLRNTKRSITDLTYDYCFETPESFSRAFKRVFGLLPSSYRACQPLKGCLPIPPKSRCDLEFAQQQSFVQPQLIENDEMILAGLPLPAGDLSQAVHENTIDQLNALPHPEADMSGLFFLVISYTDDPFSPSYQFLATAALDAAVCPPVSLQRIPSGHYARYSYDLPDRHSALRYLFYTWLPNARLTPSGHFFIEEFCNDQEKTPHRAILIPVSVE